MTGVGRGSALPAPLFLTPVVTTALAGPGVGICSELFCSLWLPPAACGWSAPAKCLEPHVEMIIFWICWVKENMK